MKVIMIHDVDKVGKRGQTVSVAKGFARNYLFPRSLAVLADAASERTLKTRLKSLEKQDAHERDAAQSVAERLQGVALRLAAAAGEEDRLYGSVTAQTIALALAEKGFTIDPRQVDLPDHIKQLGAYAVPIHLHRDVRVEVQLVVERS
jgi:large subunit ribosomal protein L9